MRVLRRTGDDLKWSAKLVSEYDEDDKHHKEAMAAFAKDILELAVVRNCFIDRSTLLRMYEQYMLYELNVEPVWQESQQSLYDKLKEQV
jgi:hypothetical protein